MQNIYSIVRVDTKILDRQITVWNNTHNYSPIIFMSPDTLKEIPTLKDSGIYDSQSTCNNCTGQIGTYEGVKVFSDPGMRYGEVELR